jgi:hypothetical protein
LLLVGRLFSAASGLAKGSTQPPSPWLQGPILCRELCPPPPPTSPERRAWRIEDSDSLPFGAYDTAPSPMRFSPRPPSAVHDLTATHPSSRFRIRVHAHPRSEAEVGRIASTFLTSVLESLEWSPSGVGVSNHGERTGLCPGRE